MMKRGGLTLVELLTASIVTSVVLMATLALMLNLWRAQSFSVNMPTVQGNARQMALTLASEFRGAALCTATDASCTVNAAVENATPNDVVIYGRSNGVLVKTEYGISAGSFYKKVGGGSSIILYPGASLTLTYYYSTTYRSTTLTAYLPTAATTPGLVAVGISSSITQAGITGAYSTLVRLRNSPLKTDPTL